MRRLNVVIADNDEAYVQNVVNYFMANYLQGVQVSSFTRQELLYDFLSGLNEIDVLLISPEMYSKAMPRERIAEIFLLTQKESSVKDEDINYIDKYRLEDEFASRIIGMFPDEEEDSGTKAGLVADVNTKVVAIYSPIGGTGKTTIAVSSSVYCGKKGLKVFYLNLESFQSTPLFFNCKSEKTLSDLLRCLKGKEGSLEEKIKEIRQTDPDYNIHYFVPPEDIIDLKETGSLEIKTLIETFRTMNYYDVVILDMSSELNDRNIALLGACDEVVMVLAQDAVSNIKAECISEQLEKFLGREGLDISGKLTVALNKYNFHMALEVDTVCINDEAVSVYIPSIPGMTAVKGNIQLMDIQGEFGASIEELMDKYI